jgi:hypothetical protein
LAVTSLASANASLGDESPISIIRGYIITRRSTLTISPRSS